MATAPIVPVTCPGFPRETGLEGTPQVRSVNPLDAKDGLILCALIRDKSLTVTIDHKIKPLKHGHTQ